MVGCGHAGACDSHRIVYTSLFPDYGLDSKMVGSKETENRGSIYNRARKLESYLVAP